MSKRRFHLAVYTTWVSTVLVVVLLAVLGCPRQEPADSLTPGQLEGVPIVRVLVGTGQNISVATTGPYRILADDRVVVRSMDPLGDGKLSRRGNLWSLHAAEYVSGELTVAAADRSCVRIGWRSYRGKVVFRPAAAGVIAVNHVDIENYLAGVLGRELYPSWHISAYQAQAIAARTYALYEMATFGAGHCYDLRDDQSSQVYGGFSAETDKARHAVRTTSGIVLAAGPEGREKIFKAHYSACCGGMVNSVYVLYGPPVTSGPLAGGQPCRDCQACGRYRWTPVSVPKDVIYRAVSRQYQQVAALGSLKTIEVVEVFGGHGASPDLEPRPIWINIVGPDSRKVRIRADDLRLSLLRDGDRQARGLYSMNCRIRDAGETIVFDHGRGFGHGVGLCQWGAQAKARQGYSVEEILSAYYPGAKLFRAY